MSRGDQNSIYSNRDCIHPTYFYIQGNLNKIRDEELKALAALEVLEEEERNRLASVKAALNVYVTKSELHMGGLKQSIRNFSIGTLKKIKDATGFDQFVIGGSWSSMVVQRAISETYEESEHCYEGPVLKANDIDLYHGVFCDREASRLDIYKRDIEYQTVEGVDLEVNTIKCTGLSGPNFLSNNDINITGTCFHVNFQDGDEPQIDLHVSPYFWKFMFPNKQENEESIISPIQESESERGAATFVRIAFKAFEMDCKFNYTGINPTFGTIAESQKVKIDKMSDWPKTPFAEYEVTKTQNYYKLVSTSKFTHCTKCTKGRANGQCKFRFCVTCCAKHVLSENIQDNMKCKVKTHMKKASIMETAQDDAEDDGEGEEGDNNN
jgi:hypothetical protein